MSVSIPEWMKALGEEDWQFLKRFLLASGSLKALAVEYGVSYPTLRNRLDRLIGKVEAADSIEEVDPFHRKLRVLVAEGKIEFAVAKELLRLHQNSQSQEK